MSRLAFLSRIHFLCTLVDALSHGWLRRFFELCTYADQIPTSIIKRSLDFSEADTAGARWPCKDIPMQLPAACDIGDNLAGRQPLPSEETAAWLPSTSNSDPCRVLFLGVLGKRPRQAGQGHSDRDGIGPLESVCETNGRVGQQCDRQAGAAAARIHGAWQGARVPAVAKVLGSGAVGPWDELYQHGGLGALPPAGWCDGSGRADVRHGFSGTIPYQVIG